MSNFGTLDLHHDEKTELLLPRYSPTHGDDFGKGLASPEAGPSSPAKGAWAGVDRRSSSESSLDEIAIQKNEAGTGTSVLSASFTLANCAIGSGVLAFPFAYRSAGVGVALAFTIAVAIMLHYTVQLLIRAAHEFRTDSFEETVDVVLGPWASHFLKFIVIWCVIGATTGYLVLIGDNATSMIQTYCGEEWYTDRHFVISVPAVMIALPLSLLNRIDYLAFSSMASIMSCCYIVGLVVVQSFYKGTWQQEDMVLLESRGWANPSAQSFLCVPICAYALGCHTQAIAVFSSLKDKTTAKMDAVIRNTFGMALGLYIPMGICGYVLFGQATPRDILDGFGTDLEKVPPTAQVGRVAIALVCLTAFPIQMWPARSIIKSYVFPGKNSRVPFFYMPLQVSALWLASVLLAMSGINIGEVFGIVGSTAAVAVVFIYPALMGLKTTLRDSAMHRFFMHTTMAAGVAVGLLGTTTTILDSMGIL